MGWGGGPRLGSVGLLVSWVGRTFEWSSVRVRGGSVGGEVGGVGWVGEKGPQGLWRSTRGLRRGVYRSCWVSNSFGGRDFNPLYRGRARCGNTRKFSCGSPKPAHGRECARSRGEAASRSSGYACANGADVMFSKIQRGLPWRMSFPFCSGAVLLVLLVVLLVLAMVGWCG